MNWLKISISTEKEAEEIVSEVLISSGAAGVEIEGSGIAEQTNIPPELLDSDLFKNIPFSVSAYFGCGNTEQNILAEIKSKLENIKNADLEVPLGSLEVSTAVVDEEDWANAWKAYFKPTWVSDFVVIKPTWEDYQKQGDEIIVEIDPGMAFGTGTHATTRMCVGMLGEFLEPGMEVIDVGCGSGILAIVAAMLGAKNVHALDVDEVAVLVTKENSKINGCEGVMKVQRSDLLKQLAEDEKADIIIANIISDIVLVLLEDVHLKLKENGMFICSGIIDSRVDEIIKKLEEKKYRIIKISEEGEWRAIAAKYKP